MRHCEIKLRTSWISTFAVLLALLAPSVAFAQGLEFVLDASVEDGDGLYIGRDLTVGMIDGSEDTVYHVLLLDEDEATVARTTLVTDGNGYAEPEILWSRTGIVGCDPSGNERLGDYEFLSHEEAESVLDGRTFRLEAYEDSDPSNPIEGPEMELLVENPRVRAFPADGSGCLRTYFRGEDIYLSIRHRMGGPEQFQVFVVEPDPNRATGDPLVDLRPGGSSLVMVPPGTSPTVALLWVSPEVLTPGGAFEIILRFGTNPDKVYDEDLDITAGAASSPGNTFPECVQCTIPENDGGG